MKREINWFDFAIEILILVIIFVMPTIFDRRLGIVFSGTKAAWMRVFGVLLLSVWSLKLIITRQHRFVRTILDWPVACFLLGTTVATLTSVHVYTSFAGFYGRYEGLSSWYLFAIFFFVVTNYIHSFEQLKRIVVMVMSASTVMAVYSIIQRHEWDPYMWGGVITWQRVIGTIGQPNFLAAYMLMAFFLLLALFMMRKPGYRQAIDWPAQLLPIGLFAFAQLAFLFIIYNFEAQDVWLWYFGFVLITASAVSFAYYYKQLHSKVFDVVVGLSIIVIYISILYTQSRGGYMGFFTGSVLFAIVAGRRWIFANWQKIGILGFFIILISGVTMLRPEYSPFERFASEVTTKSNAQESQLELKGAAGSRGETWKSAFRIIADYPVFGIGPEVLKMVFPRYETDLFRFKEAFHVKQDRCHNETFDVGVTKGLITFCLYIWLLYLFFAQGLAKMKKVNQNERLLIAGLLSASLAFLIQNQFSFGVVAITSLFWVMWGMVMVVGEKTQAEGERRQAIGNIKLEEVPWFPVAGVAIAALILIYISFFSFREDIHFKTGKTLMQMGQVPQAMAAFEKSLEVFPFEGGTISHLGIAYLNLARQKADYLQKGIAILNYGTKIDPYNADNYFLLTKIYLTVNKLAEAESNALISLKIDPYYAEVYLTLGIIYEEQGKLALAAANYEQAFFINPNLTEPMNRLEALNNKRGQPAETLAVFERALKKYQSNKIILNKVGQLCLAKGLDERALKIAADLIGLDEKNPAGYLLRAETYFALGQLNQASLGFQQTVYMQPRNIDAHIGLAKVYTRQGQAQKAQEAWRQVLILDPNQPEAKKHAD
ncbi:MAG: O-antigen ligase family protein [bacterium]